MVMMVVVTIMFVMVVMFMMCVFHESNVLVSRCKGTKNIVQLGCKVQSVPQKKQEGSHA